MHNDVCNYYIILCYPYHHYILCILGCPAKCATCSFTEDDVFHCDTCMDGYGIKKDPLRRCKGKIRDIQGITMKVVQRKHFFTIL